VAVSTKMDYFASFFKDFNQRPIGLDQTVHHQFGCLEVFTGLNCDLVPAGLSLLMPPSGPRHFGRLGAVVKMD